MPKLTFLPSRFVFTRHKLFRLFSWLACLFLISACSFEQPQTPEPNILLTPELSQTYQQTCALCHTKPATGAPQAGDTQTWQKILDKGMDATLARTINGYGGMPPSGQCFECTPNDLQTLILFMRQSAVVDNTSAKNGAES